MSGSYGITGVVAALGEELAVLASRVGARDERRHGDLRLRRGRLDGSEVVLARTGDGRSRAERGVRALVEEYALDRLLVIGVSGGLSPGLEPGAVVVAGEVLDGRRPVAPPDPAWVDAGRRVDGARVGRAVTVDRIACTCEEKAALLGGLPAGDGPAIVDLESAAFARVAAEHGIPYSVVRSVCDPAEKPLPFDLNRCLDEDGGVSRAKVLRYAMFHPAVLGPLMELRAQVDRCSSVLADFVQTLLAGQGRRAARSADRDASGSRV